MCQMPNIWHIWHINHKNRPSSALPNLKKFETRLQYRLKYETVRTQMPFPKNNFLFNIFSLLSIFYSTFSLSSHWFVSLQPRFSLSFFFRSPSLTLKSTVHWPHRSSRHPHRSSCHHRRWSEDTIVAGLKPPLPPQSEAAMSPRSEPISATTWSCSTACLMHILTTVRSQS